MELNILERVMLLGTLPKEGNFLELKIVRDLQSELSFSEEEIKEHKMSSDEKGVHWVANIEKELKEFKFGDKAKELISNKLKELDKDKKLTQQHFSLCEKFIEE